MSNTYCANPLCEIPNPELAPCVEHLWELLDDLEIPPDITERIMNVVRDYAQR
jgi:hypothetical protein